MENEGKIFTIYGWIDADRVEIRERVTFEDDTIQWVSRDKYMKETGELVGNDLTGNIKQGVSISAEAGSFA